jgi:hypothetical protein
VLVHFAISPETQASRCQRSGLLTEPGADRGPQAGSPLGVVDATGCYIQLVIDFSRQKDLYDRLSA